MILCNYQKDETQDIDMLRPSNDQLLQRLSKKMAKQTVGLRENWLNSDSAVFLTGSFPSGWEKRVVECFRGTHLVVKSVGPEDMLYSKICAHIDREEDEEDIKELTQSKELFLKVSGEVLKMRQYRNDLSKVLVEELKIRLGFNDED